MSENKGVPIEVDAIGHDRENVRSQAKNRSNPKSSFHKLRSVLEYDIFVICGKKKKEQVN